ncbi:Uncharacterised protein [Burkholderia pseudomallei]|nr:Uncharacterised protein [Burkholderia pseudomallei]CAJ2831337.1 Uncharacterised protein [Burkholderia pseudomallei]CAJ6068243.1 Uncharacterised protein [Burkholderia pseudomallei]VBF51969.1 Uncharacterised protein [Burkholderia pseudomallei]VBQ45585.1 Uncharacterised protein [Burkholderia pseudomallei]
MAPFSPRARNRARCEPPPGIDPFSLQEPAAPQRRAWPRLFSDGPVARIRITEDPSLDEIRGKRKTERKNPEARLVAGGFGEQGRCADAGHDGGRPTTCLSTPRAYRKTALLAIDAPARERDACGRPRRDAISSGRRTSGPPGASPTIRAEPNEKPAHEARAGCWGRAGACHAPLMRRSCVTHVSLMCRSCVAHVSLMCRSCVAHAPTASNASSVNHSDSGRFCSFRLRPSPPRSTTMKSLTSPSAISGWCQTPFA